MGWWSICACVVPARHRPNASKRRQCCESHPGRRTGSRWLATKATTRRRSWRDAAHSRSRPTSRRISDSRAARRSTVVLPIGRATPSANECASESRRSSAGSKRSATSGAPATGAWHGVPFRRLPGGHRLQSAEDRKALSQWMNRLAGAASAMANPVTTSFVTQYLPGHALRLSQTRDSNPLIKSC